MAIDIILKWSLDWYKCMHLKKSIYATTLSQTARAYVLTVSVANMRIRILYECKWHETWCYNAYLCYISCRQFRASVPALRRSLQRGIPGPGSMRFHWLRPCWWRRQLLNGHNVLKLGEWLFAELIVFITRFTEDGFPKYSTLYLELNITSGIAIMFNII